MPDLVGFLHYIDLVIQRNGTCSHHFVITGAGSDLSLLVQSNANISIVERKRVQSTNMFCLIRAQRVSAEGRVVHDEAGGLEDLVQFGPFSRTNHPRVLAWHTRYPELYGQVRQKWNKVTYLPRVTSQIPVTKIHIISYYLLIIIRVRLVASKPDGRVHSTIPSYFCSRTSETLMACDVSCHG